VKTGSFRVGIDSYTLDPLGLSPFEALDWAVAHGSGGLQFSGLSPEWAARADDAFLDDLAAKARDLGLYLEWGGASHVPFDMETWQPRETRDLNLRAAGQAARLGTEVIRSCSGGLMRWKDDAPSTETFLEEMARSLRSQMPMLHDFGVVLAIELHFEFTTFELLRLFDMCGAQPGGCLGICLDTMNTLTLLEDPAAAAERILPWVVATHVKDGALALDDEGFFSFPTAAGTGLVDFPHIFTLLAGLDREVTLSLEDHGGSFPIPVFDSSFLARFPDLTVSELSRLVRLAGTGARRLRDGSLRITERDTWPLHCESRAINGIEAIKRIVREAPRAGSKEIV
jgi:3-oxoisoapionate decarboxylase